MPNVIIFGSNGSIGSHCYSKFLNSGWSTFHGKKNLEEMLHCPSIDGVVWAQGLNLNKSFLETQDLEWSDVLDANLFFTIRSLKYLLNKNKLKKGSRLVIVGSVWEKIHRKNKSAYIVSKSAAAGLVRSLASELSEYKISINCVSPGVIRSPMSIKNLTLEQISKVENETPTNELVTLDNVANVIHFMISNESSGINGQSIIVDNGWSSHRNV